MHFDFAAVAVDSRGGDWGSPLSACQAFRPPSFTPAQHLRDVRRVRNFCPTRPVAFHHTSSRGCATFWANAPSEVRSTEALAVFVEGDPQKRAAPPRITDGTRSKTVLPVWCGSLWLHNTPFGLLRAITTERWRADGDRSPIHCPPHVTPAVTFCPITAVAPSTVYDATTLRSSLLSLPGATRPLVIARKLLQTHALLRFLPSLEQNAFSRPHGKPDIRICALTRFNYLSHVCGGLSRRAVGRYKKSPQSSCFAVRESPSFWRPLEIWALPMLER